MAPRFASSRSGAWGFVSEPDWRKQWLRRQLADCRAGLKMIVRPKYRGMYHFSGRSGGGAALSAAIAQFPDATHHLWADVRVLGDLERCLKRFFPAAHFESHAWPPLPNLPSVSDCDRKSFLWCFLPVSCQLPWIADASLAFPYLNAVGLGSDAMPIIRICQLAAAVRLPFSITEQILVLAGLLQKPPG